MNSEEYRRSASRSYIRKSVAPVILSIIFCFSWFLKNDLTWRAIICVLAALTLLYMAKIYIQYGYHLGLFAPSELKRIANSGLYGNTAQDVVKNWSSYKYQCENWIRSGMTAEDSYIWLFSLERLGLSTKEFSYFTSPATMLNSLGMNGNTFFVLFDMGLRSYTDFITIAKNDIDPNMAAIIFDIGYISPIEKRILKLDVNYMNVLV